jgi:hypothetical protein
MEALAQRRLLRSLVLVHGHEPDMFAVVERSAQGVYRHPLRCHEHMFADRRLSYPSEQPIVRYAEPRMDSRRILRGLVELGLIVPPPDWKEFPERVEERARQLPADAERRAAEAEAKLAEFELERK